MKKELDTRLVKLLHDCTQKGYRITFCNDFEGMMTIGYEEEYTDGTYSHVHLGVPGETVTFLEKELRGFLNNLLEEKL